jgi:glycosyltransferase involved in cell wall biosynthesis
MQSVFDQQFSEIEYIIIDGGSSDQSFNLIAQNSNKLSFWVTEPDLGIYDAMNKGINKATGEFIYFLNSGDTLYRDTFAKIIALQEYWFHADIVYGDIQIDSSDNKINAVDSSLIKYDMPFCHQAVITRTDFYKREPFDISFKIAADYDFFLKMYYRGAIFYKLPICFGTYDDKGVSNTSSFKTIREYTIALWKNNHGTTKIRSIFIYLWNKRKFMIYLLVKYLVGEKIYRSIRGITN